MTRLEKTQYLYGLDVDTVPWNRMRYKSVLSKKIFLANERIKALQLAHYLWRDFNNINECIRAIEHNKDLIKEMKK